VVVDLKEQQIDSLCQAFASGEFYFSESAAGQAVRRRGQFNIIHPTSGNKIDLLIVPAGAWGQSEISRRQRVQILPDLEGYCARPEDVILGKMTYYREGGSEKHLRDIAGILKISFGRRGPPIRLPVGCTDGTDGYLAGHSGKDRAANISGLADSSACGWAGPRRCPASRGLSS